MKTLKFFGNLPELILLGKKNVTWRVEDDKNLVVGDIFSLLKFEDKSEFAQAEIVWVKNTTFGDLNDDDWEGHERYSSDAEMYKTYSKYYSRDVGPSTKLKIIKFKLL
ncbi:MAG: ASCH domain-containing protein [Nanoarchaeota archaeon]|nr:ASCH domain-containing protein [Nanoarchaeota archaeon]